MAGRSKPGKIRALAAFREPSVQRVLIVKTTSMGDLVHALPALTDIARACPGVQIDWVAEDVFAAIPALHPAVHHIIPVAIRRWRKKWWRPEVRAEWKQFRQQLTATRYDAVIDLQGLIKSAVLSRIAEGPVHGPDRQSARDGTAALFYQYTHRVPYEQSAVARARGLCAAALGYTLSGPPVFGLSVDAPSGMPASYAALLPSTSRDEKMWQEDHWQKLIASLLEQGLTPVVFSGNDEELARAKRLLLGTPNGLALAKMPLHAAAQILGHARVIIGVDTGLTHLGGALGRPVLGLYTDSDPALAPVTGDGNILCLGGIGQHPSVEQVLAALERLQVSGS